MSEAQVAETQAPTAPPPTSPADPRPLSEPPYDLRDPVLYLNRELTWLGFNFRVLQEAADSRTPLLERVKFVAIVSSNLDEFFMKRIGGLKQQVGAGVHKLTVDGRTPQGQIDECVLLFEQLEAQKDQIWAELLPLLAAEGIVLDTWDGLSAQDKGWMREHYTENIFPLITPQSTDPAHPFPFISNLSLNLLVTLRFPGDTEVQLARVKVPVGGGSRRLIRVRDEDRYVPLEQIMRGNLDLLFPGMEIVSCELFRVTRNANTEKNEEEADDLLSMIETELRERRFAPIVRLQVEEGMTPLHRGRLAAELGLDEQTDVFEEGGLLAMRDLFELLGHDRPELKDAEHHPVDNPILSIDRNIFHTIRDRGYVLLHHPYENFSTSVERFLAEAATDPKVRAIKMTLYRTSSESKAVDLLVEAAQNGKQVAVVVEIKARFDEAANIRWASRLEWAGIHVTYGVVGLKTHCKTILVVRQDYSGLRRYAHVGTGNYHAGTARLYCDFGMLTSDEHIGRDLTELFNFLTTGFTPKRQYHKILPAPKHLKKALIAGIQREIEHQEAGLGGHIQFKMNALEDTTIVRHLYAAAQAGVKVDLIVRDTCRLRPGVPGLSECARVVSIVGRFLEHTRIYWFKNGGDEIFLMGSADAMKRNLSSRVEVVAPVEDPECRADLRFLLDAQLDDHRGGWEMRADGSYVQRRG